VASEAERHLKRAREAQRESKRVEFKERFDPAVEGEWTELIKDFAAVANSGGGVLVVGVSNDGSPSGVDVKEVLALDGAKIADKLVRYVGVHFDDFDIHKEKRGGRTVAAIVIGPAIRAPLVFAQAGSYTTAEGKRKTAFHRGGVYFRHGAKSEPATAADIETFIDRRLEQVRRDWLDGIKRVVTADPGAEIVAVERTSAEGGPTRIRITTDEDAPLYGRIDPDVTHPYRQTELIQEVNKKLPGNARITSHDITATRSAHDITPKTEPRFAYQGRYDPAPLYSDEFVEWLVDQFKKDERFFADSRARYLAALRQRRRK
jgi:Putative DNA-binding domain/EC042_2821-lke REase